MSAQPVIMFIDDEPHNLAVFEAAMPEHWDVRVFDNPLSAVEQLVALSPCVIVSDQRMPGMKGVKLLELASTVIPNAVRILVTGYSDEDMIIESVRSAKIFDYIRKPWNVEELVKRLEAALEFHSVAVRRAALELELRARDVELSERNRELTQKTLELELALARTQDMSRELASWVPPVVTWLASNKINFPIHRDLAVLAIDIIGSGAIHGKMVGEKSLRAKALEEFSVLVLKHGGYVETTEGDAAYANFGLTDGTIRPCDAALAVANEFRSALKGIAGHHQQTIECGIGLHFAKGVEANISMAPVNTPKGMLVIKRFYTSSPGIDLVHRMEKYVHGLPGSNIIMSQAFVDSLGVPPDKPMFALGAKLFKGQTEPVELVLIKSSLVNHQHLETFHNPEVA